MKLLRTSLSIALLALTTSAQAVILKYELTDIHSSNGAVTFPGLEFGNATSATITVEKTMENGTEIKSLEVNFPNIKKLTATNFQKGEWNFLETKVANAWIYRELKVRTQDQPFETNAPFFLEGFVSTSSSFINNTHPGEETPHLFLINGQLKDITPNKVADTTSAVIHGKRATFTLKERLGVASESMPGSGPQEGFIVDIMWMGKGTKTVYLPAPFDSQTRDFATAISINILGADNPDTSTWELQISCRDPHGHEFMAPPMNLLQVLNQAYPL